jgi:uncharacterized hydrophobic protein (TIGR00271 family)
MGAGSVQSNRRWDGAIKHISVRMSASKRGSIYQSILTASRMDSEYVGMLGLAGLIALFGLLQNSEAVVIGAMLISPLMNPILSAALALLLGDGSLGRKSGMMLATSVVGVIGVTCVVAWLSPLKQATPQILARTNPNLLDLFIAFLSGLAGTLAFRGSSASMTIIPGVAIAVAVIPPLAVVGYGLSVYNAAVAGGAFLLFVTNLVAIIISAALVFWLMGFRPHGDVEKGRLNLVHRMAFSGGILIVLSIPLVQTLRRAVRQIEMRAAIEGTMNAAFKTPHSSVTDLSFAQTGAGVRVQATLRTTKYFESRKIDLAQDSLRRRFGPGAKLDVDQILVAQGGINPQPVERRANVLSAGVVRPVVKALPFTFGTSAAELLADVQKQTAEMLAGTAFHLIGKPGVDLNPTPPLIVSVRLESPEPLTAQTIGLLSSQLSTRLAMQTQLRGEARLTAPNYQWRLAAPKSRRTLTLQERKNLAKLAKLVGAHSDLRLQIAYSSAAGVADQGRQPLLVHEIQTVLTANKMKPPQWAIQPAAESVPASAQTASPSSGAKSVPATTASKSPVERVDYEFQTLQDF